MRLHNYCINERNVEWCIPDLSDDAVLDYVAQYEQYIDPLDEEGWAGGRNNVRARGLREASKTS
jgi:hypothetical protein